MLRSSLAARPVLEGAAPGGWDVSTVKLLWDPARGQSSSARAGDRLMEIMWICVMFAIFWQIGLLDDSSMHKPLSPPCRNVKLASLLLSPSLRRSFGWRLGDLASFIHERSPVIYVHLFYVHGVNLVLAKSAEKQLWRQKSCIFLPRNRRCCPCCSGCPAEFLLPCLEHHREFQLLVQSLALLRSG